MNEFWLYTKIGLHHVLDINAYDHVLFIFALVTPYIFKDWKKILILVSLFTIGHTFSLILSVFEIVYIKENIVEFLIPITIFVTALFNMIILKKSSKSNGIGFLSLTTLFFGIIHGLGFSNYFKTILPGNAQDKILPLLEFAVGIEFAQIIVVTVALTASYLVQNILKFSKRDWVIGISCFIIGVVLPMIIESEFLK